ncbi:MAG TPA: barstar family protein [Clostridiaceae bacterium]
MKEIHLNGSKMTDKAATHIYLKRKLGFPDYYGENLDALWDCLTTDLSGKKIIIHKPEAIIDNLGSYGESMIQIFREAADDNEFMQVSFVKK